MAKSKGTGPSEDYTPDDEAGLLDAFDDGLDAYYGDPSNWPNYWDDEDDDEWIEEPSQISVFAEIEWAGTFNAQVRRMLRADQLDLRAVVAAVAAGRMIRKGAERLKSYTRTDARSQARQLSRTKVGREYLLREGVSARAVRSWENGKAKPSPASRQKVAAAYEAAATRNVIRERTRSAAAAHRVAEALSAALSERYGAEIRVRDISSLDLS